MNRWTKSTFQKSEIFSAGTEICLLRDVCRVRSRQNPAQNDTEKALCKELRNTGCQSFPNACCSICGKNEVLNELLGTTCSQEISRKIDGIRSFKPNALSAALPDFTLRLRGGAEEDFKVFLMYSRK